MQLCVVPAVLVGLKVLVGSMAANTGASASVPSIFEQINSDFRAQFPCLSLKEKSDVGRYVVAVGDGVCPLPTAHCPSACVHCVHRVHRVRQWVLASSRSSSMQRSSSTGAGQLGALPPATYACLCFAADHTSTRLSVPTEFAYMPLMCVPPGVAEGSTVLINSAFVVGCVYWPCSSCNLGLASVCPTRHLGQGPSLPSTALAAPSTPRVPLAKLLAEM